jgi:glutaredoxin-related protein
MNLLEYFDPNEIESINVVKKDTIINGVLYRGQINITSKNPKKYDFISLKQIKAEFTKIKSNDVIYMVNGAFIKDNIETFKLDRNYILEVEVTNSEAFYNLRKSDTKFDIINILGKTKENLENKNKILIRGHEAIGIK